MTREDQRQIALAVFNGMPAEYQHRVKAIHVVTRLFQGMLTIRCHMFSAKVEDPEPEIFSVDEILEP
jgi:hypothetical protein